MTENPDTNIEYRVYYFRLVSWLASYLVKKINILPIVYVTN